MEVVSEIKKYIQESGGKEKAAELNLSGVKIIRFSPEITAAIQQCKNLQNLILSDCELVSLQGMPKLDLQGIDLTSNKITDEDIKQLKKYPKLYQLLLTDNNIQNVDTFKQLSECKGLNQLDVSGNPVAQAKNYRSAIFQSVASLNALDGKDADGNDVQQQDLEDGSEQDSDEEDDQQQFDDDEDSEKVEPPPKKNQKKGGK